MAPGIVPQIAEMICRSIDGSRRKGRSWFGMRPSILGATGLLDGHEFHEFDEGVVRVVEIELPFAVAADFGFFDFVPAVGAELLFGGVDVGDAEGDMIHHAESAFVGVRGDVEHVFEPVGAVANLHVDPIGFVILHAAVPIDLETENVFVEMIFSGAIVDDDAGVDEPECRMRCR